MIAPPTRASDTPSAEGWGNALGLGIDNRMIWAVSAAHQATRTRVDGGKGGDGVAKIARFVLPPARFRWIGDRVLATRKLRKKCRVEGRAAQWPVNEMT